ncbi:MAG: tol-pal system protein YbgF, partial [Deltaproteobacteria bacterium]|nr:tol-pal system protein YbgF [Deltaproteobacteria bacterium]
QEMQFLNGRLEENNHQLKQSIEKDTSSGGTVADLQKKMALLEMRVDRISSYLGLEPVVQPGTKDSSTTPMTIPQVQSAKPQPEPEIKMPADQTLYDVNMDLYRREKYEESIAGFKTFLKEYPKSKLADNAAFWIGESHMALKQYEQAILAFQKVIKQYPRGNKVPNALLRQALAFDELNDKTSAKLLLRKLINQYPKTNEAKIAENKLKTMK